MDVETPSEHSVICHVSLGHCWNRCSQRGLRHYLDRWQLHQHSESCDVGTKCLWQHLKVPAISTDSQCSGCSRGIHWRLYPTGQCFSQNIPPILEVFLCRWQSLQRFLPITGLSTKSSPDVVGKPDHGHICITGSGHRATHWGFTAEETLRSQQAPNLQNHDEEHFGSCCIPTHYHLYSVVCWWEVHFGLVC